MQQVSIRLAKADPGEYNRHVRRRLKVALEQARVPHRFFGHQETPSLSGRDGKLECSNPTKLSAFQNVRMPDTTSATA